MAAPDFAMPTEARPVVIKPPGGTNFTARFLTEGGAVMEIDMHWNGSLRKHVGRDHKTLRVAGDERRAA